MKKYVVFSLLFLFLSCQHARAQSGITGNLTADSTDCTKTNSCLILNVPENVGGATFKLSGTFSATVQFEASGDPLSVQEASAVWVAISVTPSNSTTTVTSTTSAGVWQANIAGYRRIRLRVSTFGSGTVAAAINLSTASARSSGGGGGSGTIGGTIASPQIAFGSGADTIAGDSQFTWDSSLHSLISGPPAASFDAFSAGFITLPFDGTNSFRLLNASPTNGYGVNVLQQDNISTGSTSLTTINSTLELANTIDAPSSSTYLAGSNSVYVNNGTGNFPSGSFIQGSGGLAEILSDVNTDQVYGASGSAQAYGAGTSSRLVGVFASVGIGNAGGTATEMDGFYATTLAGNAGHTTTLADFHGADPSGFASSNYGVLIDPVTAGASNYAFFNSQGKSRFNLLSADTYSTVSNCSDSAGAAACGSAAAGAFVVDAASTSTVVSTTAVTANSEIFVEFASYLSTRLSVTCNTTVDLPTVTALSAGTSFTVTAASAPAVNPACYVFHIVN